MSERLEQLFSNGIPVSGSNFPITPSLWSTLVGPTGVFLQFKKLWIKQVEDSIEGNQILFQIAWICPDKKYAMQDPQYNQHNVNCGGWSQTWATIKLSLNRVFENEI